MDTIPQLELGVSICTPSSCCHSLRARSTTVAHKQELMGWFQGSSCFGARLQPWNMSFSWSVLVKTDGRYHCSLKGNLAGSSLVHPHFPAFYSPSPVLLSSQTIVKPFNMNSSPFISYLKQQEIYKNAFFQGILRKHWKCAHIRDNRLLSLILNNKSDSK